MGRLVCDYVDQLHGEGCKDQDKRTHTREELTAQAIESAGADGVLDRKSVV